MNKKPSLCQKGACWTVLALSKMNVLGAMSTSSGGLTSQLPSLERTCGARNKSLSLNTARLQHEGQRASTPYRRTYQVPAHMHRELGLCNPSPSRSQNSDPWIWQSSHRWLNCLSSISPEDSFHGAQNGSFCWELGPMLPRFLLVGHYHSHSGPFVSAANFLETYGCDVHRFFHLCCFLVHNNDLPAFISFNDPLNGEMFLCHVTCLMLAWFQKWNSLAWWWLERATPHHFAG